MIFWHSVHFALTVTLPSVLLLSLGIILRYYRQIDANFCTQASKLVFQFGLPMLLFVNLIENKIEYAQQAHLLVAGFTLTIILFLSAEYYAWKFITPKKDKGVFVQGVFRSNMGILGLAFVQNAYPDVGLASGAVYMGVITILYNVLAVLTLSRNQVASGSSQWLNVAQKIITNPLIIAIICALCLQHWQITLPKVLLQTGHYLGNISLPLALICAGATFNIRSMVKISDVSLQASVGRLVVAPIAAVVVGKLFGLSGIALGVMFLMSATSVASASYVMAKALGANDVAAANILGITTIISPFSAAIGIVILKSLHWM